MFVDWFTRDWVGHGIFFLCRVLGGTDNVCDFVFLFLSLILNVNKVLKRTYSDFVIVCFGFKRTLVGSVLSDLAASRAETGILTQTNKNKGLPSISKNFQT